MLVNAFIGKAKQPSEKELAAALGRAKAAWDRLLADLDRECGADVHEWKCYSPKTGWALRVMRKKRTIVWLAPSVRSFTTAFILGDKAARAARKAPLPPRVLAMIDKAPKYPEGRMVRLEAKTSKDVQIARKIAAVKLAN